MCHSYEDHKSKYTKIVKQDMESIQNFHGEIQNALDHANLNSDLDIDPNLIYNALHKIIQQTKLKHMPINLVKFNKYKHKISQWITTGIIQSIQCRA